MGSRQKINCNKDGFFVTVKDFDTFDKDGFYAVAFASQKTGNIILAFRGTDNIASTIQDLDTTGIGYAAYKSHISEVIAWVTQQLKEKPDTKFLLTGHSLGGALAQWFVVGLTAQNIRVDKLETFNTPAINAEFINLYFKKDYCPTVIHHIQLGDIVSMAGRANVPGTNYVYYYPWGISFITKHEMPMTVPKIGNLPKAYGTTHITI